MNHASPQQTAAAQAASSTSRLSRGFAMLKSKITGKPATTTVTAPTPSTASINDDHAEPTATSSLLETSSTATDIVTSSIADDSNIPLPCLPQHALMTSDTILASQSVNVMCRHWFKNPHWFKQQPTALSSLSQGPSLTTLMDPFAKLCQPPSEYHKLVVAMSLNGKFIFSAGMILTHPCLDHPYPYPWYDI
jgi:hypothetical protein